MKLIHFKNLWWADDIFVNPEQVQAAYKYKGEESDKVDATEMMIGGRPVRVAEPLESVMKRLQEVTP